MNVTLIPVPDARGQAYAISPADLPEIERVVERIRRATAPGSGDLTIGFEACRDGAVEDANLQMAVAIEPSARPTTLPDDRFKLNSKLLPLC